MPITLRRSVDDTPPATNTFPSGSTLLDLVNGGGWGLGRVINIVGDRSSGKTLLAIEACANFARLYGPANIRYNETEAAFDRSYARTVGLPEGMSFVGGEENGSTETRGSTTVEEFNDDLAKFLKEREDSKPSLYVLDSLDALSDKAESEREIGTATYGTGKAKAMSEMFRRQIADLDKHQCTLIVISQIRDKIGVTFGETKVRSGGRALDFYCSQIVWLSEIGKIKRSTSSVERVVGVNVRVLNKKNKLGNPFRYADVQIFFNYGVDDELSMVDWLKTNKLGTVRLEGEPDSYKAAVGRARTQRDRDGLAALSNVLRTAVTARWDQIEHALSPPLSKY